MCDIIDKAKKLSIKNGKSENYWIDLLNELKNVDFHGDRIEKTHHYFDTLYDAKVGGFILKHNKEYIFKKSLEVFGALYRIDFLNELNTEYDCLLSMIGFSYEPIMHTILVIKPKKLILVVTEESNIFYDDIKVKQYIAFLITAYNNDNYKPEIEVLVIDHTDTASMFSVINKKIYECLGLVIDKKVAIDITGGKKSMDVSAFLAASMHNSIDIFYVDFEIYLGTTPQYGTEYLSKLINPYEFFSIREEKLLFELWKRMNYFEVEFQIRELTAEENNRFDKNKAKAYSLDEKFNKFKVIQKAATCYDAWRKFDYQTALDNKFDQFNVFHSDALEELVSCPEVFGAGVASGSKAPIALKLSIDKYMRGEDAAKCHEWNRSALCYSQAVEALLRFCYSHTKNKFACEIKTTLGGLLNDLFAMEWDKDNKQNIKKKNVEPYFDKEELFYKIDNNIREKRNELSHFECVLLQNKNNNGTNLDGQEKMNIGVDYISIMKTMAETVDELFYVFADKYKICQTEIYKFKKLVSFCSLNENLELIQQI